MRVFFDKIYFYGMIVAEMNTTLNRHKGQKRGSRRVVDRHEMLGVFWIQMRNFGYHHEHTTDAPAGVDDALA